MKYCIFTFTIIAVFLQVNLNASPASVTMVMAGATKHQESTSITQRQQAVDAGLKSFMTHTSPDDSEFTFVYGSDAVLRFFLSQYPAEDFQQVQFLAAGPAFAGIRFAPFSYLLIGYASMDLWSGDLRSGSRHAREGDALLRRSSYPGFHLHLQHDHFGSLRITPLAFIDPPGRFSDSIFFRSTIQQLLSQRQTEGRHEDAHAPDRILHQARYDLRVDWFFLGLHYRTAGFAKTGPSERSSLSVVHTGIDLRIMTDHIDIIAGAVRASGSLTMAGQPSVPVTGMEYRLSAGVRFYERYAISLFAMRTEPDGDSEEDRHIGFIDYGAPSTDLPLLADAQLHGIPCVPVPDDRCDGRILRKSPPFRYPGDYGDLTVQYQGDRWGLAMRAGILVPFRYMHTAPEGGREREIYEDHAGWAVELQVSPDFMKGAFALTYSTLYDRNEQRRRRLMAQSISVWFRLPVELEYGYTEGR
jgi:hypothetical protein